MSETKALKCDGCGKAVESTGSGQLRQPAEPGWRRLEHRVLDDWNTHQVRDFCGLSCERDYEAQRLGLYPPAPGAAASPYRSPGAS